MNAHNWIAIIETTESDGRLTTWALTETANLFPFLSKLLAMSPMAGSGPSHVNRVLGLDPGRGLEINVSSSLDERNGFLLGISVNEYERPTFRVLSGTDVAGRMHLGSSIHHPVRGSHVPTWDPFASIENPPIHSNWAEKSSRWIILESGTNGSGQMHLGSSLHCPVKWSQVLVQSLFGSRIKLFLHW